MWSFMVLWYYDVAFKLLCVCFAVAVRTYVFTMRANEFQSQGVIINIVLRMFILSLKLVQKFPMLFITFLMALTNKKYSTVLHRLI